MLLCRISRALNRAITGQPTMLCAHAAVHWPRVHRVLDVLLRFYDGRGHCQRMMEDEWRGWGVSDGLDRSGL